jgi:hypothetical protein
MIATDRPHSYHRRHRTPSVPRWVQAASATTDIRSVQNLTNNEERRSFWQSMPSPAMMRLRMALMVAG